MSRRQNERLHDDVHFMEADINRVCGFQLGVIIVLLNTRIKVWPNYHQNSPTTKDKLPVASIEFSPQGNRLKLDRWLSVWGCSDMETFCKSGPGSKSWVITLAVPLFPFYNVHGYGQAKVPSCPWVADGRPNRVSLS